MKRFLLTLLLLISFPLVASHIVGGEFELIHLSGSTYRLNLILYFDQINGAPGAKDPNVTVTIYRKKDNVLMGTVLMPLSNESNVPYTQPECSSGELITTKLIYTSTLTLSSQNYNDPEGYFVVWERCCRNYNITNIYSQQPSATNTSAGQTFYLEFPPVVKNGQPFVNSSPRLFPPLNDFACPYRPYYVDFAGVDDDEDSLVYTLVTPLNTTSQVALPNPSPGPYPQVTWRPGYGLSKIINGSPDLRISKEGLLTATPRTQGLFVFAVKIDEYRAGEKIGESRRDFQMLVVDACPQAEPPKITGKKLTDASFTYSKNMSISFSNTIADADRCIQVRVSDPDASKIEDNYREKISIRAVALNFKKNISEILPAVTTTTLLNGSTKDFTICFPRCPYIEGGPYQIGIIAFDDACSLPLTDTLKIAVNVEPPINTNPYYVNPVDHVTPLIVNETIILQEGGFYEKAFEIHDDDFNELYVSIVTNGFILADAGIKIDFESPPVKGIIKGKIRWDAYCDIYNFTNRTGFQVKIIANDRDLCDFGDPATATFNFAVILPGNASPTIDTDLTSDPQERKVVNLQRRVNETLAFHVTGTDLVDNDLLTLDVKQRDSLDLFGISFPVASGVGTVTSRFQWDITCAKIDLKKKSKFTFQFIVVDNANKCRFYKADTVDVQVTVLPPLNSQPQLTIQQGNEIVNNKAVEFVVGEPIQFLLKGVDGDVYPAQDLISLTLLEATGTEKPENYVFTPVEGRGKVETPFAWTPDCSIFKNGIYENTYTFKFKLKDDRCFVNKADTVSVTIKIRDVKSVENEFLPPNVFTPNGDGCNDYFALEGITPCDPATNPDLQISLPPDNCVSRFESVYVYNRWGSQVFMSGERNFRWYATDQAAGVYFYVIKYTNKEYKGSLSLRF
ncbi:MAG: gliding motility-associated C-terminal domain-containing protein [Cyclobacteriaceae bacterium]|nr:gliding motility-associated C-terminal domain-containing protein [Cyclobacteriaceae bacterium]